MNQEIKYFKILFYWSIVDLHVNVYYNSKVIVTYIYTFLYIFHYDLSQDIECSSLCYTVGPCYWSIPYIVVCIY